MQLRMRNPMRTLGAGEGLSQEEVARSRALHGSNALPPAKRSSLLRKFMEAFSDPIIRILLVALFVNLVFLLRSMSWYEPLGIAAAVLLATLISTLCERSNESAFDKLQEEAARTTCRVRRAEGIREAPVEDVVVGDLVALQAGERVPADGVMRQGELLVDQSALNGEAKEARKAPAGQGKPLTGFLAPERLFRGSVVCSGEGEFLVEAVGEKTMYGQLARDIQEEARQSPLKLRLAHLAGVISRMGYIGAALVMLAYLFNAFFLDFSFNVPVALAYFADWRTLAQALLQAATLAVTVIVVAVPEGLPMMVAVVLSSNMKRMLRDHVLVRKMTGIETAGSMSILFTDKTGTVTQGRLAVHSFIGGDGQAYDAFPEVARRPGLWRLVEASLRYNNAAEMSGGGIARRAIGGNGTDRALLEAVDALPAAAPLLKTALVPFNSRIKFSAVRVSGEVKLTLLKGAPDVLLPRCAQCVTKDGALRPYTQQTEIKRQMRRAEERALRLVALCATTSPVAEDALPSDLQLIGLVAMRDEIRPEAAHAVRQVREAGVQVVMMTGDAKATAQAIAQETGILSAPGELVLMSEELGTLTDEQVKALLPQLRVVARALPADKSRLVRLAQEAGYVAGMTGDGVNDAPALKKADVGFAMGSGTEVAKEAGDIVILDDNIRSIARAILYGRTIFRSIRKFIVFQLTINFCAVGISVLCPLLGVDQPVTVLQMLWINMVMDTLAGLAFAGEPPQDSSMREPPKPRDARILNVPMMSAIVVTGLYCVGLCVAFLKTPLSAFVRPAPDNRYLLTAFFGLFIFLAIVVAFCARTPRRHLFADILRNRVFLAVMAAVAAVQLALLYLGGPLFRTAGLTGRELMYIALLALSVLPVDFLRKHALAGREGRRRR